MVTGKDPGVAVKLLAGWLPGREVSFGGGGMNLVVVFSNSSWDLCGDRQQKDERQQA